MEESAAGHFHVQGGCRTSWCEPLSEFCYRLDLDDRKMQAALHFSLYFLNRTINLDTFLFLNITFFTCFIQRHNFKLRRLHDKKSFSSKHISIQLQGNRDTHHQHHTVSPGLMTIGCVLLCLLHILVLCTSPSSQTKLDFYFNLKCPITVKCFLFKKYLLSFEFPFRINGMANVVPSKLG